MAGYFPRSAGAVNNLDELRRYIQVELETVVRQMLATGLSNDSSVAGNTIADALEVLNSNNSALITASGFLSIANLRSFSGAVPLSMTLVASWHTGLAKGGGLFRLDSADSTSLDNGGTVIVDAAGRRWKRQNLDKLTVFDFGAKGDWDGTNGTDDLNAFIAMGNATNQIVVPYARYKIAGTISLVSNQSITGIPSGQRPEICQANASVNSIAIVGSQRMLVEGLYLTRTAATTGTGTGVYAADYCSETRIRDNHVDGYYIGIFVSSNDVGWIQHNSLSHNANDGFRVSNSPTYGAAQWDLDDNLSTHNGGAGFAARAVDGVAGMIVGEWRNLKTYANTLGGCHFIKSTSCSVYDVRLFNSFIGGDGGNEIWLNCGAGNGSYHQVMGNHTEYAGSGATGPTLSTPASLSGTGIVIEANTRDVIVHGNLCQTNSHHGISSAGTNVLIKDNILVNNGASNTAGATYGINIVGGAHIVTGNKSGNDGTTTQTYGIVAGSDDLILGFNDFRYNTTASHFFNFVPSVARIYGNLPSTVPNNP